MSEQESPSFRVTLNELKNSMTARRGSFSSLHTEFLTVAGVFKAVELISDDDALKSLPLIWKDDALIWWTGVRDEVKTWKEFEQRLRHAFAPQKNVLGVSRDFCNKAISERTDWKYCCKEEGIIYSIASFLFSFRTAAVGDDLRCYISLFVRRYRMKQLGVFMYSCRQLGVWSVFGRKKRASAQW